VVDCTGTPGGFADALDLVRPRGTVVLKSTYAGVPQADLTRIVVNEIRVVGNRCGPFEVALRLLERNLIDVRPMIDACYPLAEAVKAFAHAAQPGALKIVLAP
jgi:threonine dehydrogenase-like Zn-dependent dehydrogenase